MVALVKEGVREIERRLYEEASDRDRELLEHFVAVARRSRGPVIALNSATVITNPVAARLLDPSDHMLLWSQVAEAIAAGTGAVHGFRLSEGSLAQVRFAAFEPGDPRGAWCSRSTSSQVMRARRAATTRRRRCSPSFPAGAWPGTSS